MKKHRIEKKNGKKEWKIMTNGEKEGKNKDE